jgi:Protein involved in catabolism of external DNA
MLSYKHGYHAGNHADVLKHIVLIYLYNLVKKHNKSISYVDTHSGNGLYKYISRYMEKNKEYKYGIKKIEKYTGDNKLLKDYLKIIKKISKKNNFYPGSPLIISNLSTNLDKLYFCELHNNEFNNLKKNLNQFTNIKNINVDGFTTHGKKLRQ